MLKTKLCRSSTGQAITEAAVVLTIMVPIAMGLLLLIVNIGMTIMLQQRANLLAYNAAEVLAKRTSWLGLELGDAAPQSETSQFLKQMTAAQSLPPPTLPITVRRTHDDGSAPADGWATDGDVFLVSYQYRSPLFGGMFGTSVNMRATATYVRPQESAPLVLRIARADGSSILVPSFGLNGPTAVGQFTPPTGRFDGYYVWNATTQQIESENKPATLQ